MKVCIRTGKQVTTTPKTGKAQSKKWTGHFPFPRLAGAVSRESILTNFCRKFSP